MLLNQGHLVLLVAVTALLAGCGYLTDPTASSALGQPSPTADADDPAFEMSPSTSIPSPTPSPVGHVARPSTNTPAPTSPAPVNVSSLPSVRWIGRLSVTQGWAHAEERLLWTGDAGSSWSDITPAGLLNCPEPDICFIASPPVFLEPSRVRIAVVRGKESAGPTTLSFMYTDNGGSSWGLENIAALGEPLLCPGPACISGADLAFPSAEFGWLAAHAPLGMSSDLAYMYRTQDSGRMWTPLEMPVVGKIVFIDESNGWAIGSETRWNSDRFIHTQDGAMTWGQVEITPPDAYTGAARYFHEPTFLSRQVGVLPVRFFGGEGSQMMGFYVTHDGGRTWSLAGTLEDRNLANFGTGTAIPWTAVDASTWFVALGEDAQFMTHDAGQTWEAYAASGLNGAMLLEVQFASEAEGWGLGQICNSVGGCAQPMFATHDGGRTWALLDPTS